MEKKKKSMIWKGGYTVINFQLDLCQIPLYKNLEVFMVLFSTVECSGEKKMTKMILYLDDYCKKKE